MQIYKCKFLTTVSVLAAMVPNYIQFMHEIPYVQSNKRVVSICHYCVNNGWSFTQKCYE